MSAFDTQTEVTAPYWLPDSAHWHNASGVEGWLFTLSDPYGDEISMFLWENDSGHIVTVVEPAIESVSNRERFRVDARGRLIPLDRYYPKTAEAAFQHAMAWLSFQAIRRRQLEHDSYQQTDG